MRGQERGPLKRTQGLLSSRWPGLSSRFLAFAHRRAAKRERTVTPVTRLPTQRSFTDDDHAPGDHSSHGRDKYQSSLSVGPDSPSLSISLTPESSFRPQNSLEIKSGGEIVVTCSDNLQTTFLRSTNLSNGPERDGFTFDRVFPMDTKQSAVFDYGVKE